MEIILIVFLTIVVIGLVYLIINKYSVKMEHIINTDDSIKIELKKCCSEENKCFSKPGFLNSNCDKHKKANQDKLSKSYDQMFTTNQYNSILRKLKLRQDIDNTVKEHNIKELNLQTRPVIKEDVIIGINTYNRMINDNIDSVNGYDNMHNLYPNYNKNIVRTMII
jgi:hypothetical protein